MKIALKKINDQKNIIIPAIYISAPNFSIGSRNVFSPNVKIQSVGGPIIIGKDVRIFEIKYKCMIENVGLKR